MRDPSTRPGSGGSATAGREKVRRDLVRLLGRTAADGLLERRDLAPGAAGDLLADRRLAPETLRFLFALPGWSTDYPVKAVMALHPRCPLSLLRVLVNSLRLTDLVQVMASREIPRAGARMAAELFGKRLPEMPLGRKKQLARTGGRAVHEQLMGDRDPQVLDFLLAESPLLTESDLLKLLRNPRVAPEKVDLVALSDRWRQRYRLRLELARHPLTAMEPRREAAAGLLIQDLQALLEEKDLSTEAQQLLYTVLRSRIDELSDGEQLALARSRPGRHTVNLLLGACREPVLLDLLQRTVLDAAQVLALANDPRCPEGVLETLAGLGDPPCGLASLYRALLGNPTLAGAVRERLGRGMVKPDDDNSDK